MSTRQNYWGKKINDNNLFFTLSAYYLLKDTSLSIVSEIENAVEENLSDYKNKYGGPTYNFWRTLPYEQFPGSRLFSKMKHFWIPDDLDCSSLSYLFHNTHEIKEFRSSIQEYVAKSPHLVAELEMIGGFYSTWFGRKMPVELDVCVLCNFLSLIRESNLELNRSDVISYSILEEVIRTEYWLEFPFELSPNYQKCSIIAFHLSRFVRFYEDDLGESVVSKFKLTLKEQLIKKTAFNDILMLSLACLELKIDPGILQLSNSDSLENFLNGFAFFRAPMLSNSRNEILKKMAQNNMFNLSFMCRGFNAAVVLKIKHDLR